MLLARCQVSSSLYQTYVINVSLCFYYAAAPRIVWTGHYVSGLFVCPCVRASRTLLLGGIVVRTLDL